MPTVVIPFAGIEGKSRLDAPGRTRRALSLAMLGDVVGAAVLVGGPMVVTADVEAATIARSLGAEVVDDPGGGQGRAVAAALVEAEPGPLLIVNADLPCVVPEELRTLLDATPARGLALVEASDGTTNALGISAPEMFAPVYGPDSANRFREHARSLGAEVVDAELASLTEDVDTLDDLRRLRSRCGPRTQACLLELPVEVLQ